MPLPRQDSEVVDGTNRGFRLTSPSSQRASDFEEQSRAVVSQREEERMGEWANGRVRERVVEGFQVIPKSSNLSNATP